MRYSLIAIFCVVFVIGLLSRGNQSNATKQASIQNEEKPKREVARVETLISNYDEASDRREIMDKIRENPKSSELHNEMGVLLAREGLTSEAILHFQQALDIDPKNAAALYNLGLLHEYIGDFEKAKEYFNQAKKIDPSNKSVKSSLKRIDFVIEYQPEGETKDQAYLSRALIAMGRENTNLPLARNLLETILEKNPSDPEALNALGVVTARQGNIVEAEQIFARITTIEPGYMSAYVNLATINEANGNYTEAIRLLERAINLSDENRTKREIENRVLQLKKKARKSNGN